jgi:hypothetical protein
MNTKPDISGMETGQAMESLYEYYRDHQHGICDTIRFVARDTGHIPLYVADYFGMTDYYTTHSY